MSKAELVIKSDSVLKTTEALDRLITKFEELGKVSQQSDSTSTGLKNNQTKVKNALDQTAIAQAKAISLMQLERQGLDSTSSSYAKLKAEILAKELAAKKGLKTDTEEYKQLLKNIKAKELATAKTKKLTATQKAKRKEDKQNISSLKNYTDGLDNLAKQASLVDGPLGGVASRITTLSSIMKSVGGVAALSMVGVSVAGALLAREFARGLSVAIDAEVQMKSFEAQVRATGGAAGFTAQQMDDLSRSIAMATLDNRQGVSEIIGVMATFQNITTKAFTEAVSLSQDFGLAMRTGPVSAARTLGKVLEDPINNYKQLSRAGINFSDEEKERIAQAQQAGNMYEAQSVIIGRLEEKFGGLAKAQADTLAGDIDTFGQMWEETFERIGAKAIPASRSITQLGISLLELQRTLTESEDETDFRIWKEEAGLLTSELDDNIKKLEELKKKQSEVATQGVKEIGALEETWNNIDDILYRSVTNMNPFGSLLNAAELFNDEAEETKTVLEQQIEAVQGVIDAQSGATKSTAGLTDSQKEYIESIELQLSQQKRLTDVFKETGDTRSKLYRETKAAIDTENAVKKQGLELNKEETEKINGVLAALSALTEQRIISNTAIQKTKAIETKIRNTEKEIELYNLLSSGLVKNSDEYYKVVAAIDAKNSALSAGIPLGSEEHKNIEAQTEALYEQQKALRAVAALKATDGDSSVVQSLERQLELQNLVNSGVAKNSSEYFKTVAAIDTRNTAARIGLDTNSEEYQQLLLQNEAIASLRNQIQQVNNLKEVGLQKDMFGKVIAEDTRAAILDQGAKLRGVLDELLSSGEIDKDLYQEKIDQLKTYFNENLKELTIPLGITLDEEGSEILLSSVEAVYVERNEKLKELEDAWRSGNIQDEIAYAERRNEIMREYDQSAADRRQEIFEKSSAHLKRIRQMEVADSLASGLETLAGVKETNSGLAKAAKVMSMFSASTALVDSIANATKLPWPENIPAIAQAFTQGTQLISMASSLNEPSFAFGGVDIQGKGTARSDSIKANIASGESVVTAPATAKYKDTLRRMNAGLPINSSMGGRSISAPMSIVIQGDASERTIGLIDTKLRAFETRVQKISQGESVRAIQQENEVGGFLNPI